MSSQHLLAFQSRISLLKGSVNRRTPTVHLLKKKERFLYIAKVLSVSISIENTAVTLNGNTKTHLFRFGSLLSRFNHIDNAQTKTIWWFSS